MSDKGFIAPPTEAKAAPIVGLQEWTFKYKMGPAQYDGVVRGKDEAEGYRVAVRWCETMGIRPPAKVFPRILADPSILATEHFENEPGRIGMIPGMSGVAVGLGDPVAAANVGKR